MSERPSFTKSMLIGLAVLLSLALLAETFARAVGYRSFVIPEYSIISEPDSSLMPDTDMGYILMPGNFTITINDGLSYQATHEGPYRSAGEASYPDSVIIAEVGIFGCSFTYGMGVNDSESLPYLLNTRLQNAHVNNYAVPGYGTIQAILQLEKMIAKENVPDHVVYCYNDFHNSRNSMARDFQLELWVGGQINKKNNPGFQAPVDWAFPYGVIQEDSLLIRQMLVSNIRPVHVLKRKSALANLISKSFNREKPGLHEETKRAIDRLHAICRKNSISLHIAFMTDPGNDPVFSHCGLSGIPTMDISVNLDREGYRNLPWDHHPSATAHLEYADKLGDYLETNLHPE